MGAEVGGRARAQPRMVRDTPSAPRGLQAHAIHSSHGRPTVPRPVGHDPARRS
jgi:hypothetical protein